MFVTYYSKIQNSLNGNHERLVAKEMNKLVTKSITKSNWDNRQLGLFKLKAISLANAIADWRIADPKTLAEHYITFRIPKQSGGYRTLNAPDEELKAWQNKVLDFLVKECKILCHNAVHSFVKHRSSKTALAVHKKHHARWFLKLDVKDFFDSCIEETMYAELKTIHPLGLLNDTRLEAIFRICFLNGGLPQGAPTSPMLSNLYMLSFDYWLTAELRGYTYTRYADDILISKPTSFTYSSVVRTVQTMLPTGLHIKPEKTRYGSCNGSNWNLGLMYNKDRQVTVGYRNKHLIKNRIHNLFTEPYNTYEEEQRVLWGKRLCELRGLISYYKFIEPDYFNNLINKYRNIGYEI